MVQEGKIRDVDGERRKHRRSNFETLICHEILTDDEIHTGKMYNFSRGGLYFESDQTIFRGDEILIKVLMLSNDPDSYEQFPIDVQIIWQRDLKASAYKYGYGGRYVLENEFIDRKTYAPELQTPDSPAEQSEDNKDPRNHPRKILNQSLLIRHKGQIHKGLLRNLSSGGAYIETSGKFILGTDVELVISAGKTNKKSKKNGKVVRFSRKGIAVCFAGSSARRTRNDSNRNTPRPSETRNRIDNGTGGRPGFSNEMPFEF